MATYSKHNLSSSPTGIPVFTYQAAQSLVHTVPLNTTDELWLYATNSSTTTGALQIEVKVGSNAAPLSASYVEGVKTVLLVAGIPLTSDGITPTEVVVSDPNIGGNIYYFGYVNRITA